MKYSRRKAKLARVIILGVMLFALAAISMGSTFTTSVNIENNSTKVVRNVYLSPVDTDNWSANQLGEGAVIAPGTSANLTNLACDQQQVKVIAEDQDGCFLSTVVNCGSSSTWTVTNDTTRDCGQ